MSEERKVESWHEAVAKRDEVRAEIAEHEMDLNKLYDELDRLDDIIHPEETE